MKPTCARVVAGLVHLALEELKPHDGVDGDQQEHEQRDVQQGQHGFEDGGHYDLKACEETGRRGNQWACDKRPMLLFPFRATVVKRQGFMSYDLMDTLKQTHRNGTILVSFSTELYKVREPVSIREQKLSALGFYSRL